MGRIARQPAPERLPIVASDDGEALASSVAAGLTARLRAAGCVFAEEEAELLLEASGSDGGRLEALAARRVAGEPLEQVLGWVAFAGRRWAVAPGVFVPRQRSELLVGRALASLVEPVETTVVDLCCGNGALGGAVAASLQARGVAFRLHAADVDPGATACAAANLDPWDAEVHTGDLYAALPLDLRGRVNLLICHAPYVPTSAIALMPPEAREHEPLTALDGGADGLDILRRVIAEAPAWLAPSGTLLFELGDDDQLAQAQRLLAAAGLTADVAEDDETGAVIVSARHLPHV